MNYHPPVDATTTASVLYAGDPERGVNGERGGVATDVDHDGCTHCHRSESRDSSSLLLYSLSSPLDLLVLQVQSSSAAIGHVNNGALAYDAETACPDDDCARYGREGTTTAAIEAGGITLDALGTVASNIQSSNAIGR